MIRDDVRPATRRWIEIVDEEKRSAIVGGAAADNQSRFFGAHQPTKAPASRNDSADDSRLSSAERYAWLEYRSRPVSRMRPSRMSCLISSIPSSSENRGRKSTSLMARAADTR